MTRPNPWGENWHNENYTSAEMDTLLGQIFGPKLAFMGFSKADKRKWVKTRKDGTMEVVRLVAYHTFVPVYGLSFPWVPHGNCRVLCWHKTAKQAVIDFWPKRDIKLDWHIWKGRTVAAEKAKVVSTEVCEICEPWFKKMEDESKIIDELKRRASSGEFNNYPQARTVYLFWQARLGRWKRLHPKTEEYLKSYFGGENGIEKLKALLANEAEKARLKQPPPQKR